MSPILAGAMAGGGEAVERSALTWQKAANDQDLTRLQNDLLSKREIALESLRNENAVSMKRDIEQPFQTAENDKSRQLTRDEGTATRQNARDISADTRASIESEGRATREHQSTLSAAQIASHEKLANLAAKSHELIAGMAKNTQLAIAAMGTQPYVGADGKVLLRTKDGGTAYLTDPDGKPFVTNKDLTPAAKAIVDVYRDQLKSMDKQEADGMLPPDGLQRLQRNRMEVTGKLLSVLKDGIKGAEAGGPQGRTGWDNTSGDVVLNGQTIGTAKSQDEATRLLRSHRAEPAGGGGTPLIEEPPGSAPRTTLNERRKARIIADAQRESDDRDAREERGREYSSGM